MLVRFVVLALSIAVAACSAPPPRTDADSVQVDYYIDKLPDRGFVSQYGDNDNPRTWYKAAEALGQIGKPAIPALIARLDTPDPYELKLVLYALMLASQDPALLQETGGHYLQLSTVLTEETNDENRDRACEWWRRVKQRIRVHGDYSIK